MQHSPFWFLDHHPETGESVSSVHEGAPQQAIETDRLGFTSHWLAEHHLLKLGTVPNSGVLLAAIAQRTEWLRHGLAILVLSLRKPIHLAENYLLVDGLSGGRLNMGAGTGPQLTVYTPFGIESALCRRPYTEKLSSHRRRWAAAVRADAGPNSSNIAPLRSSVRPIYVASMHEDGGYQTEPAGDSLVTLVPPSASGVDEGGERVGVHAQGRTEGGHAPGSAESVVMMFAHVAEKEAVVKETVVRALDRLMPAMTGGDLLDVEAFNEQMRQSAVGLFGTPSEVVNQLQRLSELGIDHVAFVSRFGGMSRNDAPRTLRLPAPSLAREHSLSQGSIPS